MVETRLDAKIDTVKLELSGKIDKLGASVDTLKWLFGLVAAMNLATFVRLVVHPLERCRFDARQTKRPGLAGPFASSGFGRSLAGFFVAFDPDRDITLL